MQRKSIDLSHLGPQADEENNAVDLSHLGPQENNGPKKALTKKELLEKFKASQMSEFIPKPLKTMASDVGNQISSLGGEAIDQQIPALLLAAKNMPEAAHNALAGGAGLLESIMNIPRNTPANIEHLTGVPGGEAVTNMLPKFDFAKYAQPKNRTPEGNYIQHLVQAAPLAFGGLNAAKTIKGEAYKVPALKTAAETGIKGVNAAGRFLKYPIRGETKVLNPKIDALKQKIFEEKEKQLTAKEQAKQHEEEYNAAVGQSKEDIGKSDPALMVHDIKESKKETGNLQQDINQASQELQQMPHPDEVNQHVEAAAQDVAKAEQNQKSYQGLETQADKNIGENLFSGKTHTVHLGEGMREAHIKNKKSISNIYDEVHANAKEHNVEIPEESKEKAEKLTENIIDLWNQDKLQGAEAQKLGDQLREAQETKTVNGSQFINIYKSVNGYIREAYKKAYKTGINEEVRTKWLDRASELEEKKSKMTPILKDTLGAEDYASILKADERWKNEVASLYEHPVYRKFMKSGKVGKNVIEELSGSQKGSDILKSIIKQDQNLLRHAVGQHQYTNMKNILEPNELLKEYTDLMPELQQHIQSKKSAQNLISQGEEHVENITSRHKEISSQANQYAKEYGEKQKYIEDRKAKIKSIDNKINDTIDHIQKLKKTFNNKNTSLKEHDNIGREISKAKNELSQYKAEKKKSASMVYKGGKWMIKKAFSKAVKGATGGLL